jgi:hypothetical protein
MRGISTPADLRLADDEMAAARRCRFGRLPFV